MALSNNTAWEVRPTNGSDTNGGGFVAGSGGTDFSQQNAAQVAVSDAVANGTNTLTSATANFLTTHVGNLIYLSGGTGSLVGDWYGIVSRTNSTTIILDRTVTTGTGITLNLGGALKTLAVIATKITSSNKVFFKAESTQQISASIAFSFAGSAPQGNVPYTRIIGYTTSRTDKGQATIQLITNTGLIGLGNAVTSGLSFENFIVDCNNLGTSTGITILGSWCRAVNCKVINFTSKGIDAGGQGTWLISCEVTAGTSAATAAVNNLSGIMIGCNIHDNACTGVIGGSGVGTCIVNNLITNNTGATSDGVLLSYQDLVLNNTIHGSGRDNIRLSASGYEMQIIWNNILTSAGATAGTAYGFNNSSGIAIPADVAWDGNAYWNNKTAARNGVDDTTVVKIDGVSPYTNVNDKILTSTPYVSTTDFELNSNAGSGAVVRTGAVQKTIPNATGTTNLDMGTFQHLDAGNAAPLLVATLK